jgi:Pvc16 N-terminal domain
MAGVARAEVIAAASSTLRNRLVLGMQVFDPNNAPENNAVVRVELHDLVELPPTDPATVTLFLYQILEHPSTRNRAKTTQVVNGAITTLKQPLSLCLQYMVTAWAGDRESEQRYLGRVLQVLYDDAILDGLQLAGVLAGTPSALHVSLSPIDLEDRSRVWSAIRRTYRLSVNYEVRVLNIDAETETSNAPVRERDLRLGVPV